jgi:putative N-acetyltransferase (TIGR04045 family)
VRGVQRAGRGGWVSQVASTTRVGPTAGTRATPAAEAVLWHLGGPPPAARSWGFLVEEADAGGVAAHRALRRRVFVDEQRLFADDDADALDADPGAIVLVARTPAGHVVGGVRLATASAGPADVGWWTGSRLVVEHDAPPGTGSALVRAACARAEAEGALRFEAVVQADKEAFFARLGWEARGPVTLNGRPHVRMRWPLRALASQAAAKGVIGDVLGSLRPGSAGFVGDDGAPVPGTDIVVVTDAVLPTMVERDPWWAGWCSVLVNANDLAAMGATPVGLTDAVGAPTRSLARRVLAGMTAATEQYGIPVLGGHTQVGVPAALSVTMLGRSASPVPGGGGRPGDTVSLVADLAGGWRPGYRGRQWDSTTARSAADQRRLVGTLGRPDVRRRVRAAKDVSMAGLTGTLAMLAEASGCGAELDVPSIPRPADVGLADWLACFPGFALVTAGDPLAPGTVAPATAAACGRLVPGGGVTLVWPDGERTVAVPPGPVVGLGPAAAPADPPGPAPGHPGVATTPEVCPP